jgi:hypothetical protein
MKPARPGSVVKAVGFPRFARARLVPVILSSLFLLMGLGFLVPFFVIPMTEVVRAQSWVQAGCAIEHSRVASDGEGYSVKVAYHYEAGGVRYSGSRPHFMGGSSTGLEAKQRMVDGWVPGTTVPCWVNPRRPDQAVLYRGLTSDMWFALIPGVFVLVGVLAVYGSLRAPARPALPDPSGVLPDEARVGPERRTLAPESSPGVRFVAMLVAALFWNGVVQVFVREAIDRWRAGGRPVLLTIFMVPFVVIGLGMLGAAFARFLGLWSPRASLTLNPGRLVIGERAAVEWELRGKLERVKRMKVTLEGRERTPDANREGGMLTTVFTSIPVGEGDAYGNLRRGSGRVEVPPDARPSFKSAKREIRWVLKVHGEIDHWPDFVEEFPVGVLPRPSGSDT